MTAKELKKIIGKKDDEQPLGVASILNVRSGSAKILPIYIYDFQFDQCKCSVEIPNKERRQIGVGGAIAFCGKTLLLTLEHLKLINQRFIAKKSLSEYVRKQGEKAGDISHIVDDMSRPWVTFDICIISWCNTSVPMNNFASSSSKLIRVTESGGIFVHINISAAKCNFQSSIFTDCGITTTPWTPVIFSTNIAPCIGQKSEDEIFEPLWDRELRNGKMGTGLVVAREETSPLIKANGIQFINCDGIIKNIYIIRIDRDEKQQKIVNEELSQIKAKIKPNFKQLPVLPLSEDASNLFIINKIELNSEKNKLLQFRIQLSESERKKFESEERLRITESKKGEEERKWIQAELGKRDAQDKAGIAEQRMKYSEEQIVLIESKKKEKEKNRVQMDERQKEQKQNLNKTVIKLRQVEQETEDILLLINCGYQTNEIKNAEWIQMKIDLDAEEKNKDENVEQIKQKNIIICQKIIAYFTGKKNSIDGRKQAIEAGTIDALLRFLSTQPLERISLSHIYAFFIFTNSSSDEIGEMLNKRNPYISLIHLFDHQDFFIINRAAISMFNLLNIGARTRPSTAPHPHYQNIVACNGIQKLFRLFKKYANRGIKISTSLCIGYLFKAKGITDQSMRREIISYLKKLINEDQRTKNVAKYKLINLARYIQRLQTKKDQDFEMRILTETIKKNKEDRIQPQNKSLIIKYLYKN
ncbi:MAG: hypothetical protein EZS28_008043 [Streblomastix strix]|uniref:Uncharacterized protein n=1 Tax=Streblomastix strix TaxID=222440 RepID=A0A5J4WNE0_9EUKA|nr:MAG: hypothetical protein EZS28_008043 [Streblomastix strix]